jgi:hypothetical protein
MLNLFLKFLGAAIMIVSSGHYSEAQNATFSATWGGVDYDNTLTTAVRSQDQGILAVYSSANYSDEINIGMQINKFDATGEIDWSRHIQIEEVQLYCYSVIQTRDQGFALAGQLSQFSAPHALSFIYKFNEQGELLWKKHLIRGYEVFDGSNAYDLIEDAQENLYICGSGLRDSTGLESGFLAKLNAEGLLIWSKHYKINTSSSEPSVRFRKMTINLEGKLFVAGDLVGYDDIGSFRSELFLVSIDHTGKIIWVRTYSPSNDSLIIHPTDIQCDESNIYLSGLAEFTVNEKDPDKEEGLPPVPAFTFSTNLSGEVINSNLMRSDKSAVSSITRDHSKVYIYHTVIRETEADKPNIRLTAYNL